MLQLRRGEARLTLHNGKASMDIHQARAWADVPEGARLLWAFLIAICAACCQQQAAAIDVHCLGYRQGWIAQRLFSMLSKSQRCISSCPNEHKQLQKKNKHLSN